MTREPIGFESSIAARTPAGDVLIALFGAREPVILAGSADAALSLIAGVAESLRSDNGKQVPDVP